MTNVFRYLGIQDVADLAARVRAGELGDRAGTCSDDFYEYPLPVEPYPSVDDRGRLQLPHAARVG